MHIQIKQILTGTALCVLVVSILTACNSQQLARDLATLARSDADTNRLLEERAATKNVANAIAQNPSLRSFYAAMGDANLDNVLDRGGPYTIFAPSDRAFAALPKATRERLLKEENRVLLRQILDYHVVTKKVTASQLQSGRIRTQGGNAVDVRVDGRQIRVNDSRVVQSDLQAENGVVHIVDRLLLPPNVKL